MQQINQNEIISCPVSFSNQPIPLGMKEEDNKEEEELVDVAPGWG